MTRISSSPSKSNSVKKTSAVFAFCATAAITLPAQTLTTLVNFDGHNGAIPLAPLVQGVDGNFYGTTYKGGPKGERQIGSAFRVTPEGTLTTLHFFYAGGGAYPAAALVPEANGNFLGTASNGGSDFAGTIFELTAAGTVTTLLNFNADITGEVPNALLQVAGGNVRRWPPFKKRWRRYSRWARSTSRRCGALTTPASRPWSR